MDTYISDYHDFTLDKQLSEVEGLTYQPWVGKDYFSSNHKTLIIAESVYDWDPGSQVSSKSLSSSSYARHVVRENGLFFSVENVWPEAISSRLFRNIKKTLFKSHSISNNDRLNLWTSVAFHEFVQRPMPDVNTRPTGNDYQLGARVLTQIVNLLNPSLCIYLGTDYQKLKHIQNEFNTAAEWITPKINGAQPKVIDINDNETSTKIVMIKHPSKFYSWSPWSELLGRYAPQLT